jgi:hypothetical protein
VNGEVLFPVELIERADGCAIQGYDAEGGLVCFDDLLGEGDRVATYSDDEGNCWPPLGTVVRRDDGLWIEVVT